MNQSDYERAIAREVEEWPGVEVVFTPGGKHPKAKFTFGGKMLSHPYASTPSDAYFGIHAMLGDMRRTMRKLGAARIKPDPTKDEDEAPYKPKNDGAAKREAPRVSKPAEPKPDVADQLVNAGAATPAQAKAAKGDPADLFKPTKFEPTDADAALREEFLARVAAIRDGIYFGLPADVYHAVPRLSCSGIQKLCVSPATFWRNSWLDPDRPEDDEDSTIWRLVGRAYHTARLEPHLFDSIFVRELSKDDMPKGTLFTGVEMGRALEDAGLKKSGSVAEQAERLADSGFPTDKLWHFAKQAWEEERKGRSALPAKHYDAIVIDMERIRASPQIAELLNGGEAEVSIFWTDKHGIPMKSRLDYLTRDFISDLKTYDNSRGKNVNQAITQAVQFNRYYIQPVIYREAVDAIRSGDIQIIEAQTDDQRSLIAHIQLNPNEMRFWFIFQEKGGVPNLFAREFEFYEVPYTTIFNEQITDDAARRAAARDATSRHSMIHLRGAHEALEAKKQFELHRQVFAPGEPWVPLNPMGTISDADFPPYFLEGGS